MSARQRSKRTAQAAIENEAEEIAIACVPFFLFFFFFFFFFVFFLYFRSSCVATFLGGNRERFVSRERFLASKTFAKGEMTFSSFDLAVRFARVFVLAS